MNFKKITNLEGNIEEIIITEINNLTTLYSNYQSIENELYNFMNKDNSNLITKFSKEEINNLLNRYQLCTSYIHLILSLIDISKRTLTNSLEEYKSNNDKNSLQIKLDVYNNYIYDDLENNILKFENDFLELKKLNYNNSNIEQENSNNTEDFSLSNDTLLISEKKGAVILPYQSEEIKKLLDTKKYKDEKEIIDKVYTISLSHFNNATLSRFNEAYKLVISKEKGSFSQAFDLGLELMFKSNLHPAIIKACKNLKELDYFLDCLDENRLSEFSCFKVKFEMFPSVIKN